MFAKKVNKLFLKPLLKRIKFILIYISDFQLLLNINFHGLSREFSITLCLLYRVMHSINKSRNFKEKRKKIHFDKHHNSNGITNQSSSYSSKARGLARLKPNTSKISMKLKKKLSYLYLSAIKAVHLWAFGRRTDKSYNRQTRRSLSFNRQSIIACPLQGIIKPYICIYPTYLVISRRPLKR